MKCPQCGGMKHRIPESRRTEQDVWRLRICGACHRHWVTQEVLTTLKKMPTEVNRFHHRNRKPSGFTKESPKTFDTTAIASLRWQKD